MSKRGIQILCFILLCGRIAFIFSDAANMVKSGKAAELQDDTTQEIQTQSTHNSADDNAETKEELQSTQEVQMTPEIELVQETQKIELVQETSITTTNTGDDKMDSEKDPQLELKLKESKQLDSINIEKVSLATLSSKVANKTETLESLYQKTKDERVLKVLIDNLLSNYQFDTVREYLSDIDIFTSQAIDKKSYMYTYINTLSITDPNSMKNFISFVEQLKSKSLISSDEYLLYKGLQKVWDKDYDAAIETLKQISSKSYYPFIEQLESAVLNFKSQKGMPSYYQDALVALTALKNGYFSIANKLAVYTILEDNDYVLPYQVLAYSNFLTKNWEKAISYFYDLSSLDIENKNKYDFYLGICYYWKGEYESSLTTLYQLINDSTYKTDVYRYLLLNYEQLNKYDKMAQIRQKLLGEDSLTQSDFKYFYDIVFYKPFSKGEESPIYEAYKQMSYDTVSMCYDKFGYKNDTCLYGEVGFNIVNGFRVSVEENLIYLSENYPQASIYQALGDYYKKVNEKDKAKSYYIKAVALSDDSTQKTIIQNALLKLID